MNNFWEVLGISPTDNKKEIRAAYAAKSKLYHPEEQPEEFAKLKNAYKAALDYIVGNSVETSNININTLTARDEGSQHEFRDEQISEETLKNTEKSDSESEDLSVSLLSRLQDSQEQEIKKSMERGALKNFIAIFEQAKESGKFPRADVWKDFFLSEEFLSEQYSDEFAKGMIHYLSDWSMKGNYHIFRLPDSFLVELAVAYALTPEQEYIDPESSRMIYRVNGTGFLARETAADLWSRQEREYPPVRILNKNENLVRLRSFADYMRLRTLNSQNVLTADSEAVWHDLLMGGCVNYIYELNGKGQRNIFEYTRSMTLIKLYTFWLENNHVPDCILEHMYKNYDLKSIERSSREKLYAPLKQAILKRYPDIEDILFGEESKKQLISSWYRELAKIVADEETDFNKGIYEETETIKARSKQLFEQSAWRKIQYSQELLEKLSLLLIGRESLPETLAEHLTRFYSGKDLLDGNDKVMRLLENIRQTLSFKRKVKELNGILPITYETANIEGISDDNMEFWSYYLMVGFGFRNVELEGAPYRRYSNGPYCCLPYYMKCMYEPSVRWRELFTGFDEAAGASAQPVFTEFTLPDGKRLKVEFHFHYCLYFLDDKPVYSAKYTFEECLEFSKYFEKTEHKFFLLAITSISEEKRGQAAKIIEMWLSELNLYSFTTHMIASMLAADHAGLLQDISNISELKISEDEIQAVYYNEDERFCFRAVVTEDSVILFYKSDFGWLLYDENSEKYKSIAAQGERHLWAKSKLESLRQPKAVPLSSVSLEGMDNKQKAEKIIDAFICHGKFKSKKELPYEAGYPWQKDEISAPVKEFFTRVGGFLTESYCVLRYGKETKREEIFYFAVRPFESDHGHGINYDDSREIKELNKKIKEPHLIVGCFGLSNACSLEDSFSLRPFAIGISGTYYVYDIYHMYQTNDLSELMAKIFDFSGVTQVEAYQGFLSISNFDGKFEYCYGEDKFKESAYSMELTDTDKFARFTKAEMMLEFADWLDTVFDQDTSEVDVLCFELHCDDTNMYSLNLYNKNIYEIYEEYYNDNDNDEEYSDELRQSVDKCCILNGNKKLSWKIWGTESLYLNLTDEFEDILLWYMDYGTLGKKLKNCRKIFIICQDNVKSIVNIAIIGEIYCGRKRD